MRDLVVRPPLPTWARYRKLFPFRSALSLLRTLEYEALNGTLVHGRVLDFGGGGKAKYGHLISRWRETGSYESINIDPKIDPTWLIQPGEDLPSPPESFDTVVTLNTLEHVYDAKAVLTQLYDALKPEGRIVVTIPFLFRVHAHPDDYFRATPSWWSETLMRLGFADIRITPLIWGPFSTGMSCGGLPGPFKKLRFHAALLMDILYAKLRFPRTCKNYDGPLGQSICDAALGYLITARK